MNYFLTCHSKGYSLSFSDYSQILWTGFSGAPYADRHREMGKSYQPCAHRLHRAIALIEYCPLIGGIAATLERLAAKAWEARSPNHWKVMERNRDLAIKEHQGETYVDSLPPLNPYDYAKKTTPLVLSHTIEAHQGRRLAMEDAHVYTEFGESMTLAGVFDGHGGAFVAKFAARMFQAVFPKMLENVRGNVLVAFERMIEHLHHEAIKKPSWSNMGTTAVVCLIERQRRLIFTATLGDSEANIYRKIDGQTQSIPLSCVRDWTSPSDRFRLELNYDDFDTMEEILERGLSAKHIRTRNGLNVSRAIGDAVEGAVMSHHPKVTVNTLKPRDIVVIASDGLKDYVQEEEIVDLVDGGGSLAQAALLNMDQERYDNVTVIQIGCQEK